MGTDSSRVKIMPTLLVPTSSDLSYYEETNLFKEFAENNPGNGDVCIVLQNGGRQTVKGFIKERCYNEDTVSEDESPPPLEKKRKPRKKQKSVKNPFSCIDWRYGPNGKSVLFRNKHTKTWYKRQMSWKEWRIWHNDKTTHIFHLRAFDGLPRNEDQWPFQNCPYFTRRRSKLAKAYNVMQETR